MCKRGSKQVQAANRTHGSKKTSPNSTKQALQSLKKQREEASNEESMAWSDKHAKKRKEQGDSLDEQVFTQRGSDVLEDDSDPEFIPSQPASPAKVAPPKKKGKRLDNADDDRYTAENVQEWLEMMHGNPDFKNMMQGQLTAAKEKRKKQKQLEDLALAGDETCRSQGKRGHYLHDEAKEETHSQSLLSVDLNKPAAEENEPERNYD